MCQLQIAEIEVSKDETKDLEHIQVVTPEVEAACMWLDIRDDDGPEALKDIFEIIRKCLGEARKLKTGHTVKIMTQLTAVTEYIKLCAQIQVQICQERHLP